MKITIQNLSKAFGGRDIFSDFSLDIDSGVRLCVCGPNGCGKSTLIRMLADADAPDSGRIIMPRGCRVGYVQQDLDEAVLDTPLLEWVVDVLPDWHDFWSAWEAAAASKDEAAIARLGARQAELEALYGYNPEHKAQAVLSGLGFDEGKWHLPIKQLSGGWRERAKLARVLVAGADVLLLDEPTTGLDPNQIVEIRELIKNIGREKTVIMSSHILAEIEATCDRVLIINKGKIVADGTSAELRNKSDKGKLLKICIQGGEDEDIYNELALIPELENIISSTPHHFEIQCERATEIEKKIFDICCQNNWYISEMTPVETRLEDIFRQVTKN